ncbi:transcriptional repressor LexA [Ferruginivarius sediminum]|uniref:LexA repressor n=1 Tax=Ferruginivarius sediminum TaxID=2661937 RepID=A0A369TA65_9PROT|nr:transcriptional repressor LexA [Ferruginivarius sediminum]RDD62180.1 transcriptional repressor LexA [Ferruginivarius sediminum]
MLTRKQHELLLYIHRHLNEYGVSPSFDEMKDALGLKSKSGIHRLISGLEERKFLRRLPHRARALEVLRLPENTAASATKNATSDPNSNVVQADFRGASPDQMARARGLEAVQLPLYGRIAAGTPIEALRDESAFVDVPGSLLGRGDYYCLEVEGDSMVDAGILDGDTVIIERCDRSENGSIVVALVDGEEVTLKRIRRRGQSVALEPANQAYETRIFPPGRVNVQGRLVGLVRRY